MNKRARVIVGMSGGVDSSVCAAILKEQGHEVVGLFMKNWEEVDESGICHAEKDYEDVQRVCDQLDIPCYSVEFVKEYWDRVFSDFLRQYERGYTPNPDIACNREIKFDIFFEKAMQLGGDYLATGHYCRIGRNQELLKGLDPLKDQSYFLHAINGRVLDRVLFPIGDLKKTEVRAIASRLNLYTKEKKDSTGICFIGEKNFRPFLQKYLGQGSGPFKTLKGEIVGNHHGVPFYTLGQRKGLGLGGPGEAWFVVAKDLESNTVYVERGERHQALYGEYLYATDPTWIDGEGPKQFPFRCRCKLRYRQSDQDCIILSEEEGTFKIVFDIPQRAMTPGQSIVFYDGDRCLGGAMIDRPGPSFFQMNRSLPEIVAR